MWIRSGDIRDQSRKLSEIAQNFKRFFGPPKFMAAALPKIVPSLSLLPLTFLHTLEIDQGLIAHTTTGTGIPQNIFIRENLKLVLKFDVLGSITSGLVGVSPRDFFSRRPARQQ